jgi:2-oxoglutarate dehydrogenase E2 component (dihydrolipoamide succinyltransferase)
MPKHLKQLKAFLDERSPDGARTEKRAMATEIRVPTLGESVTEATIGRWFKKAGDAVAADEPLVELETDKVTVEVPAPAAGVLEEIRVKDGETVGSAPCSARSRKGRAARRPRRQGAAADRQAERKDRHDQAHRRRPRAGRAAAPRPQRRRRRRSGVVLPSVRKLA